MKMKMGRIKDLSGKNRDDCKEYGFSVLFLRK